MDRRALLWTCGEKVFVGRLHLCRENFHSLPNIFVELRKVSWPPGRWEVRAENQGMLGRVDGWGWGFTR